MGYYTFLYMTTFLLFPPQEVTEKKHDADLHEHIQQSEANALINHLHVHRLNLTSHNVHYLLHYL